MNDLSGIVKLVRVADECLVHHFPSPGEGRDDKHAWRLIDLASHELLSYQVHAVTQGSHEGNCCIAVEGCELILTYTAVDVSGIRRFRG